MFFRKILQKILHEQEAQRRSLTSMFSYVTATINRRFDMLDPKVQALADGLAQVKSDVGAVAAALAAALAAQKVAIDAEDSAALDVANASIADLHKTLTDIAASANPPTPTPTPAPTGATGA